MYVYIHYIMHVLFSLPKPLNKLLLTALPDTY